MHEFPNYVDEAYYGGCCKCPYLYGYESSLTNPCNNKYSVSYDFCEACWNREIEVK